MSTRIDRVLQKDILALMLSDVEITSKFKRVLEPSFFTMKAHRFLFKEIIRYYDKYNGELPNRKTILIRLSKKIKDEDIRKNFRRKIIPIFKRKIKSPKGIEDEIYKWAEQQKFAIILSNAARKAAEGQLEVGKEIIRSSFLFDTYDEDFDIYSLFEDWKKRQRLRKDSLSKKKNKQIKTNFGKFDKKLMIRLNEPCLALLMGTSGVGKSIFAINFGVFALKANANVAHFVFENTAKQTLDRYDSLLLGYPYNRIKDYSLSKRERSIANKTMRKLRHNRSKKIKVIHAPIDTINVPKVEALLREFEIKEDWIPDVIIYDMLDDMLPSIKQESFRLGVKKTIKDIKRQTEMRNIPIFCTSHAKAISRGTTVRQESFSESYDRPRTADVVMTISQTQEQEDDGQAEFRVDKFRDGEGKISVLLNLHYSIMKLEFVEEITPLDGGEN